MSICQELLQLSNLKRNNPIKKYAKNLNRQLSRDDVQMADKHRRCLTLVIGEMLIENYSEILLNTLKMAIIKKAGSNNCWQAYGEIKTLIYCLWECKYGIAIEKQYGCSSGDFLSLWPCLYCSVYLGMPVLLSLPVRILPVPQSPAQLTISQAYSLRNRFC